MGDEHREGQDGTGPAADPAASVIVPTYRDWAALRDCLAALGEQDFPEADFEILVVNNDPGDPAPEDLPWPDNARLLAEAAKGSYAARNRALAEARGRAMLFTDADCRPARTWVSAAVAALDEAPVAGGRIEMVYSRGIEDVGDVYARLFPFRQDRNVLRGWAATANMAARRAVFDAVGPFDPLHVSGGDAEWGTRARFLLRTLKQTLVPPTKPLRPLFRLQGAGPWLKLRTYGFVWRLRLAANIEGARILFLGGEGERR